MTLQRIPARVDDVTIERAWPQAGTDVLSLIVEGKDAAGHVRAGRLVLDDDTIVDSEFVPHGRDPQLPALADAPGVLIGHRFGKRAVLHDGDRFLKAVRPKKQADVIARNTVGAEVAEAAGFLAARPRDAGKGLVETARIPGVSLAKPFKDSTLWSRAWGEFARRWPTFASSTIDVPAHDPAREAGVLLEWVEGALDRRVLVDLGEARSTAHRIAEQLVSGDADSLVTTHRDLHDAQLLFDEASGTIGVLDLDTLARSEAALDLGNMSVHALLKVAQGRWSKDEGDVVVQTMQDTARKLDVTPRRFELAEAATALRIAAVWAYRPGWQDFAQRWLQTWLAKPIMQ